MNVHPAAELFPLMAEADTEALALDIRTHGLLEPIIMYRGELLDGRNRLRACEIANVTPHFVTVEPEDPTAYVVSVNLKRRHLDESQRALVAARLATLRKGANQHSPIGGPSTQDAAAELLNVGKRSVERAREVLDHGAAELVEAVERGVVAVSTAADIAAVPKERQREIVARGESEILAAAKAIRAERTEVRRAERIDKIVEIAKGNKQLGGGPWAVIYADPPWRYEHAESESRAIENQYPTMELDEICNLGVEEISTPDAILFMWATSPKLAESMRVLAEWGFNYRTCAVWVKDKIGMGYYFRQQHELLLVATRGEPPVPAPETRVSSVIMAPRSEHSAKPSAAAEAIERMYPTLPRVELFCRSPREGWDAWGNQS